jgi:hypothetical protein
VQAATPLRGPLNTFTVYDERLVTAETFTGAMVMRDPNDVMFHLDLFARFEAAARPGDAAREELAKWAAEFRSLNLCEYSARERHAGRGLGGRWVPDCPSLGTSSIRRWV